MKVFVKIRLTSSEILWTLVSIIITNVLIITKNFFHQKIVYAKKSFFFRKLRAKGWLLLCPLLLTLIAVKGSAQGQTAPCDQIVYSSSSPEGNFGTATCDGSDSYLFTTYEQNTDIDVYINYTQGKSTTVPWTYRVKVTYTDYTGASTDITHQNFFPPDGYHYTTDANYASQPFFTLSGQDIATYGRGSYMVYVQQQVPGTWMDVGSFNIIVIPKVQKIWVEADPVCEKTYSSISDPYTTTPPDYTFKIKTEPSIEDIVVKHTNLNMTLSTEGGYFDPASSYQNVNPISISGLNTINLINWIMTNLNNGDPEEYKISGTDLWYYLTSSPGVPLEVKIKFDDQVAASPIEFTVPIIINTPSSHLVNTMNSSDRGAAFNDYDYVVNGKEVWTPSNNPAIGRSTWTRPNVPPPAGGITNMPTYRIAHSIVITPGSSLTVQNMNVEFGPGARVIVQATPGSNNYGGRLKLDNANMNAYHGGSCYNNNIVDVLWEGITVQGNSSKAQSTLSPNANGATSYQGLLEMQNNSLIAYARNGVRLWDGSLQTGGGIVKAQNSTFTNNKRAVEFEKYQWGGLNNVSSFDQCNFITNSVLPSPFFAFISGWGVKGVAIRSCYFSDNAQDPNATNYGVFGEDASFYINNNTSFWNLEHAFHINDISGLAGMTVKNSYFENNGIGVITQGVKVPAIQNNDFSVPSGASFGDEYGVALYKSTGYTVTDNTFHSDNADRNAGILVFDTGFDPNEIKSNSFNNFEVANLSNWSNLGLQYLCNANDDNNYDIAVEGAILYLDGIGGNQGSSSSPAGNTFSSPFTGHVDISNPSNIVTPVNYYYSTTSGSNEQPVTNLGTVTPIGIQVDPACSGGSGPDGDYPDDDGYVYGKIHYFLTDDDALQSDNARDSLYYWVRKWDSPSGKIMETDMLMEDGNVSEAFDL